MSRIYIAMSEQGRGEPSWEVFRTKREAVASISGPAYRTKSEDGGKDEETDQPTKSNRWERAVYTVEVGTTKREQMRAANMLIGLGEMAQNHLCGDPGGPIEYRRLGE